MPNVKGWLASLPERLYINKKKYRPSKMFRNMATERLLADAGHDIVEHDVVMGLGGDRSGSGALHAAEFAVR